MMVSFATSIPSRDSPPVVAPHMMVAPPAARSRAALDRHADQGAVLGPRAVVVLDVRLAEQLVQHEPGVRRALADAAVGDGVLAEVHARAAVERLQILVRFERAVVVGRLGPRD